MNAYLLRPDSSTLTKENIDNIVQFGTIGGRAPLTVSALERMMKGLVDKQVSQNSALTDGARNELSGHYHRVMATLTDTVHVDDGKTVLYCPAFDASKSVAEAAKNKDMVQIIESIVIHWTRQIKDVVNNAESGNTEISGPLDEIDFWKGRAQDLLGIQEQIQGANVTKITEILVYAKSNYIGPFDELSKQLVAKAAEANDNLKYLESIRSQCTALREIEPEKLVTVIPDLLSRVRLIWLHSTFYNSEDRVCGLLRKISNEIIMRFKQHIPVRDCFDGDVDFCVLRLREAIDCGVEWKSLYHKTVQHIHHTKSRYGGKYWAMDDASIFAQVDAFVQRCRDLIEVCESQMQFCRKSGETKNESGPLPLFGGTKSQEITDALVGIEASFEALVDRLRRLEYDILDVRISRWHDDYHHFKNTVKDLEVMFTNTIVSAYDNNSTVLEGVLLIETFHSLAKREAVKRCVERKAADMRAFFIKQIGSVRAEFEQRRTNPPIRPIEPQYAGSALWAHSLFEMIKVDFVSLAKLNHLLGDKEVEEYKEVYHSFATVMRDFKHQRYQQWIELLNEQAKDNGLQLRLDKPILRRMETEAPTKGSVDIVCNFDEDLLALFSEVNYWEKFHGEFTIPYIAHDICTKREQLRVMREQVMFIVRAYNDIIKDMNAEEKRLFLDHMRKLDRKVGQGLNKLTWQSKNMIEMYVKDCVANCAEVYTILKEFKECKVIVNRSCKIISGALMIKIDKNAIYEENVFENRQKDQRASIISSYQECNDKICSSLLAVFKNFKEGSPEVLREWKSQISQIDKSIEISLKGAVKRSLQELSKAINGDSKTDPQQLFTVRIVLEAVNNRVTYSPSMMNLTNSVNVVAKDIISVATCIPRFKEVAHEWSTGAHAAEDGNSHVAVASTSKEGETKSYYDIISDDNDILRIVVQVMNGMSSTATELQKYLSYWDKYKALWEADKDQFMRKYAKSNRNPAQFDTTITQYRSQQADIQGENSTHTINFVRVDCNNLKDGLIGHCLQYQNKLTGLLNNNGAAELTSIFALFKESAEYLGVPPKSLDELSEKITKCKELREQQQAINDRFDPVRDIYETLAKFEVVVKDDELKMKEELDQGFDDFKQMLGDSEKMLDKSKVGMKKDLEAQMESYGESMTEMRAASQVELPFSADKTPQQALALIEAYNQKIAKARETEAGLTTGLAIFGIVPTEHKDLQATAKDLDLLTKIWNVTIEWESHWEGWKQGKFSDLDVEDMENIAGQYTKQVSKLGREIKRWRVWESMKDKLDKFREITPLIQDMRNKALRSRHWLALIERVGTSFDPTSPIFTLNDVVRLDLAAHGDFIGEMSANANKELAIETALNELQVRWADVQVDVGPYKEKYFKLKSTDDISQVLEDDSVALSTMKASKFYGSFQVKIDEWEHILSVVSEVIEMILGVQRKWIYLESIFMGGW